MKLTFHKYQATGNDFVMVDQRMDQPLSRSHASEIEQLCDRRYGIGADGLILLQLCEDADFEMVYFNSDGKESTMCGNGGRCFTKFAQDLGLIETKCTFKAIDGMHEAIITNNNWVELAMIDVNDFSFNDDYFELNTGSPHYVTFRDQVDQMDVKQEGALIRYSDSFKKEGINVNFVESTSIGIKVRTYERGVEDETLSCGTGVTAAALVASRHLKTFGNASSINVQTKGGDLCVKFEKRDAGFKNIWLCGPAHHVFSGSIEI